jgi:hypothetical protein
MSRFDHLDKSYLTSARGLERLPPARFQCLYCKKHVDSLDLLRAHEAQCDAGIHVRKMWARRLERARKQFARTGTL